MKSSETGHAQGEVLWPRAASRAPTHNCDERYRCQRSRFPAAESVRINDDPLSVELGDGRTLSVPLASFPRLSYATRAERKHWRLIGREQGIHWEDLDEDISVENLLAGRSSGESHVSFKKWLEARGTRRGSRGTQRRRPTAASGSRTGRRR
jgi:hypothetical protein